MTECDQQMNAAPGGGLRIEPHLQEGDLCNVCKTLDITDALKVPSSINGREIMPLGTIEVMKSSSCPLCRLFFAVHTPLKPNVAKSPKTEATISVHSMDLVSPH